MSLRGSWEVAEFRRALKTTFLAPMVLLSSDRYSTFAAAQDFPKNSRVKLITLISFISAIHNFGTIRDRTRTMSFYSEDSVFESCMQNQALVKMDFFFFLNLLEIEQQGKPSQ